ncbi:MAG: hypothetical protein Q9184_008405, partial [Pyrenodesmia sp. 2 TL-2023]
MNAPRDWSVPASCYQQPLDPTFPVHCTIELRHPGLPDSRSNLLFRFPAYDHLNGGVHHSVALTACAIVAGNKWGGYLSETAGGPPAADGLCDGIDTVLTSKRYYFHPHCYSAADTLSTASPSPCCSAEPYPVYPTFQDWKFPHQNLPRWWPEMPQGGGFMTSRTPSNMTNRVRNRDGSCRLTGSTEENDVAHIIPVSESAWFTGNEMADYAHDTWTVDNSANLVLLRKDIHHAYDHFKWTIAPKSSKWCCIYIDSAQELGALYHNVEVRSLHGVSAEYLLAGFASAIFYLLYPFLNNNASKRLVGQSVGTQEPTGTEVSGVWCTERFRVPGSRNRSTSPPKARSPKRKYAEDNVGICDADLSTSRLHNSAAPPVSSRKRRRTSSATPFSDFDCPKPSQRTEPATNAGPTSAPCTCVITRLPTPESTESPHMEPPDLTLAKVRCRSKSCRTVAEFHHHNALRRAGLEAERARSKVEDWWQGQIRWAKDCSQGRHDGYDVEEWFWVKGAEVLDENGEYLDTNELFGRK